MTKIKYLDSTEASKILKITRTRFAQLCKTGKIKAVKMGRDWFIDPKDLPAGPWQMKAGRPKKS